MRHQGPVQSLAWWATPVTPAAVTPAATTRAQESEPEPTSRVPAAPTAAPAAVEEAVMASSSPVENKSIADDSGDSVAGRRQDLGVGRADAAWDNDDDDGGQPPPPPPPQAQSTGLAPREPDIQSSQSKAASQGK